MVVLTTPTLVTSYSLEGIFLGMNIVLYSFCAYTLWGQKSMSCRALFFINTLQFLLCVLQFTLHSIHEFIVFTVLTPGQIEAYLHRINVHILGTTIIYNVNFVIGGILSIWRLYVLYDNDLRVCVAPFSVWIGEVCTSGLIIQYCTTVPVISTRFNGRNMLLWAFIAALNLLVTIPICIRLCIAQKRTHDILSSSPYKTIAIILVECGALITLGSVIMMILYARYYAYALASLGAATEVAIMSQLLITARHAMLSQSGSISTSATTLDFSIAQTDSRNTVPCPVPIKSKSLYSFPGEHQLEEDWKPLGDV